MPTSDKPQKITLGGKIRFRVTNAIRTALLSCSDLNAVLSSGITIQLDSYADWIIYNEIFVDGEYRNAVEHSLSNLETGRKPVFLDLGANVGFFTLYLIDRLRRRHKRPFEIKAVEGSPTVFGRLKSRLKTQTVPGEEIQLYHGLVGRRSGTGTLFEIGYHGMASLIPRRLSRATTVPFLNLDEVCADVDVIDLLKCDIEGAEEEFLNNWKAVIEKTKCAVFEFHPAKCDTVACKTILLESGFHNREILRQNNGASVELFWR